MNECNMSLEEHYKKVWPNRRRGLDMGIMNYIIHNFGNGRLLDIGCGFGELLSALNQFGFETYGVVATKYELEECLKKGCNVLKGDAGEGIPYEGNFFNFVTLIDSIEHINNWNIVFDEVQRVLKNGGRILIVTPNKATFYKSKEFQERQTMIKRLNMAEVHVKEFDVGELREELKRRGFHKIQLHNRLFFYPNYFFLRRLDRLMPAGHLPYIFLDAQLQK